MGWVRASASAAVLAMLAVASDGLRERAHAGFASAQRYQDVYYVPPAAWLGPLSLGWREAFADLLWMRALIYFGDELHHDGEVRHAFDYAHAIAELDPRFPAVYHWIGMAALYHPGQVSPREIERAIAFMERGARLYPDDGQMAWDVGATLVFELAPILREREARRAAYERGTEYLLSAARRGAAPEWAVLSNARILARVGQAEQAAGHLEDMYLSVRDPQTRVRIAERIRELRSQAQADAFMGAMQEIESARARDFPYVPPLLYLLIGQRPLADTSRALREGFARTFAEP